MFEQKPTLHLAKGMAGVAIAAMLLGTLLIGVTSWKAPGWVIVTYGLLILYLAYHVSAAPCLDDPDTDEIIRTSYRTIVESQERLEELTAESLAGYRI